MNPDGTNRRYLGSRDKLLKEFNEMRQKEALAPDGKVRVYNTTDKAVGDKAPQIYIQRPPNEWGYAETWKVSKGMHGISYDPVWSPDGRWIAFVSEEGYSDDIWIGEASKEGTNVRNCTPNGWEWDKHPSWSPDSSRIVFWSNRDGLKQIYVVDAATCQTVRRLTTTAFDEYDPIWVK
jgi:TolB protein